MLDAGEYEAAISAFKALGDYTDSAEQLKCAKYFYAETLIGKDDAEARKIFLELDNYKESKKYVDAFKYLVVKNNNAVYTYNQKGQITEFTKSTVRKCQYNTEGDLIRITLFKTSGEKQMEYVYEYDSRGNCTKRTLYQLYLGDVSSTTTYTYNSNNQCITSKGEYEQFEYFYDEKGILVKAIEYSDSYPPKVTWTYEYDAHGNMTKAQPTSDEVKSMSPMLYTYTYDENGNMLSSTRKYKGGTVYHNYEYGYIYAPDLQNDAYVFMLECVEDTL